MKRIGEYFGISFWKFGKNFRKYGKSLEKIGKSVGEIPFSASDNMNSSQNIHYFSQMQHPLILKNIYPCQRQLCKPPTFIIIIRGRLKFLAYSSNALHCLTLLDIAWHCSRHCSTLLCIAWHCMALHGITQHFSALLHHCSALLAITLPFEANFCLALLCIFKLSFLTVLSSS